MSDTRKRRIVGKPKPVDDEVVSGITPETIFEFVEFGSEVAEVIMDSIGDSYE